MRLSYLWIKSLIETSLSPHDIAEILTMAGLEVEDLEPVGPELEGIFVGEVLEVRPHPHADKLTLCRVNLGDKTLEVVCGAPNVKAGQKVPFIAAGVTLPDGTLIEARPIRGVRSEGMICSGKELQLSEDAEGIMVLDPSAEIGSPLQDVLGSRDWSLNIEVTINRPDCLSHLGVARELAAARRVPFCILEYSVAETGPPIADLISVEVLEPDLCPRYSARVIRGVSIAPSPDWIRWRLETAGLRAINNVVDVTNYVLLELGHPLHAFDLDRLAGRRIRVRCATPGEKFITLDEVERELDERMLLICDAEQGVALAGVMGGANSEISDATRDLLLESAYFDPINTRRTSKLLNLSTDSSQRFERGADPNATVRALDCAAELIVKLAGGELATGFADVYPQPILPRQIELRPERVQAILGVDVPGKTIGDHLRRLGCEVEEAEPLLIRVPTHRPDLEREIDLIEEVARLHHYDLIPTAANANISLNITDSAYDRFQEKLCDVLVKLGFAQVLTSSLLSQKEVGLPGYPAAQRLKNPSSEDMAFLRNGLLPGLLKVTAHNQNRGTLDLRIFEIGRVFSAGNGEWDVVSGLLTGMREPLHWDQEEEPAPFLDLKGTVEDMFMEISLDNAGFFHYDIKCFSADVLEVRCGDSRIGVLGQIHPLVARTFEIEAPVFAFEFQIAALKQASQERLIYRPIPRFPPLQRDLAFTVAEVVAVGPCLESLRQAGGDHLVSCELFDVYRGPQIGDGKKSLAFRLSFQSADRTLTDVEVDQRIAEIIQMMAESFGARIRS